MKITTRLRDTAANVLLDLAFGPQWLGKVARDHPLALGLIQPAFLAFDVGD